MANNEIDTSRTTQTIPLSVIVVTFGGLSYLPRCLEALVRQIGVQGVEILVTCDDRIRDVHALQGQFPGVRFLSFEGHRTYAELRALGVHNALGRIVALTEDHCTPNLNWCAQIIQAHDSQHAAVGGAVDKEGPDTVLNWALYLADYARYMNPMPEGPSNNLTDCNVSYKRAALDAIAGVWRDEFHEPAVHGALQARGDSLWLSPRIVVYQQRSVCLGDAVRDRYSFGRLFGSGRVVAASTLHRLIFAGFTILLPPLLVGRVARHVFRKRHNIRPFIRALPMLVLLSIVWTWGEFVGYITGCTEVSLTPKEGPVQTKPKGGQEVLL